jgi:uncharacterized protein (DUF427 family)
MLTGATRLPGGRTLVPMATNTFTPPAVRAEPTARRIRVRAGGALVADSRRATLLIEYGPGRLPTYLLPEEDVDLAAAERVGRRIGDDGPEGTEGLWTFPWDGTVAWFEEAMEVVVHARDPRHRVDALPSDRHVVIEVAGEVVAESRAPHAVFETYLPTRWYLPMEDVRRGMLEPSDLVTSCPYKGTAGYWSVRAGGELHEDLAWSYPHPIVEQPRLAGLVAFFDERVDVTIDGERQERPITPWSR